VLNNCLLFVYNIIGVLYFGNIDQKAVKFKVSYSYIGIKKTFLYLYLIIDRSLYYIISKQYGYNTKYTSLVIILCYPSSAVVSSMNSNIYTLHSIVSILIL